MLHNFDPELLVGGGGFIQTLKGHMMTLKAS